MGQRYINKGCGRPCHQFMERKYKKSLHDIWYFGQWEEFCQDRNLSPTNASISEGSKFLLMLCNRGLSYWIITPAMSMLSAVLSAYNGTEFHKHPIMARILKVIFRNRPALPRYMVTYDPELALNFLKSLSSWNNITLKGLGLSLF